MSKAAEEKRLFDIKIGNVLAEARKAVEKEKTDLEVETNTRIVGMIRDIGAPVVRPVWREGKVPAECFWQSKKAFDKRLREEIIKVDEKFKAICVKYDVISFAVITALGAEIGYDLTKAKKKLLMPVIEPPHQPQPQIEEK